MTMDSGFMVEDFESALHRGFGKQTVNVLAHADILRSIYVTIVVTFISRYVV